MIITILIVGLILRLINLNQSLWLDEAVQAITSQGSFFGVFSELQGDFHPPLYHVLMLAWVHLFGSSEIILRLPSVLFGLATIYVVFLIAQEVVPKKSSISGIAALFLATAPFHIYYSQEARPYALATLLTACSMYFFLKSAVNNFNIVDRRPLVEYVIFSSLMLYSDYFGLFILLTQAIVVLILARKKLFSFLVLQFLCLLFFLPWLPMLWTQIQVGQQAVSLLPEWGRLVNVGFFKALPLTFIKFSLGRITIFNKTFYVFIVGLLFMVYSFIIARGFFKNKKLQITNCELLISLWLIIPLLSAWLISFFVPNYQPFRLLLVLPAFYLLLTWGISNFQSKMIRIILTIFILLVNLVSVSVYYKNPYFHREDWRGVVRFIELQNKSVVAILPSTTSDWPWRYYSEGKVEMFGVASVARKVQDEDFDNLTIQQSSNLTIYYIRYLQPVFDPQEKIISWLRNSGYVKIREISFNQIPVWEYTLLR